MINLESKIKQLKKTYPELYFVFRYQDNKYTLVSYKDQTLDKIENVSNLGLGIHVFDKEGNTAFSSTNILSDNEIDKSISNLLNNLNVSSDSQLNKNKVIFDLPSNKESIIKKLKYSTDCANQIAESLSNLTNEVHKLNIPKQCKLSTYTVFSISYENRSILRTDGTNVSYQYPNSRLNISLTINKNGKLQNNIVTRTGSELEIVLDNNNLKESIINECQNSIEIQAKLTEAPKIEPGNYNLLLDGQVGAVFIHEAFGHTAEADSIKIKSPLAQDGKIKKGLEIAPKYVNVIEKSKQFARGYTPFDSYGSRRKTTEIIKNGILNDYLGDFGHNDSINLGNSRAQTFADIPISRMSNTILNIDSSKTFNFPLDPIENKVTAIYKYLLEKNILKPQKKYLYLVRCNGGQVSTEEGSFQFNSVATYMLHNQSLKLYKGVSFSGKTLSVLNSIKLASSQMDYFPGSCGKRGQNIPVLSEAPKLTLLENSSDIKIA